MVWRPRRSVGTMPSAGVVPNKLEAPSATRTRNVSAVRNRAAPGPIKNPDTGSIVAAAGPTPRGVKVYDIQPLSVAASGRKPSEHLVPSCDEKVTPRQQDPEAADGERNGKPDLLGVLALPCEARSARRSSAAGCAC
eukprot:5690542-Prymnesium_polylepis.2